MRPERVRAGSSSARATAIIPRLQLDCFCGNPCSLQLTCAGAARPSKTKSCKRLRQCSPRISMSLQAAHQLLGWPAPARILSPTGSGPAMLVRVAKQKLESAVRRIPGCQHAVVGVLTDNPEGKGSQAPLAVVVEFNRP